MKKFLLILCALFLAPLCLAMSVQDMQRAVIAKKRAGEAPTYCEGISWETAITNPDFTLDFDHTDDNKKSCGTNEEIGVLAANTTIASPPRNPPSRTGNALLSDGADEYIYFDNSGSYFASTSGELAFKLLVDGNDDSEERGFYIWHSQTTDRITFYQTDTASMRIIWEDNNDAITIITSLDYDNYLNDWIWIHIRWDTTRCNDGAGDTCGDAGEDEFCWRYRVDGDQDGSWDAAWSSWVCEEDVDNFLPWAGEPDTDNIEFGDSDYTPSVNFWTKDFEIKSSSSW